jgi:predicted NAD/FAD-binding protein
MPSPSPKPVGPIPRRIGIVGGGISGIACLWTLRNHNCSIDLFEADERLGGHANSVNFVGNGQSYNVDTGFIVMDEKTYRMLSF